MKLATFSHEHSTGIGVLDGEAIIDLAAVMPKAPPNMIALLRAGEKGHEAVRQAAKSATTRIALTDVTLHAPILRPGKIMAIGLNYGEHIAETGREPPKHQIWFNKQTSAINDPFGPVNMPAVSSALDYEAELCFVIGKTCKHVPKERAHEVIGGFFCGNDFSVRDWQAHTPTMVMGKSFDTHAPIGPWLVTPDEIGDPHGLDIKCWVNDELRQDSNTSHMIFDCYDQIAYLSQAFTLNVGDVIFTGTPEGVGVAKSPPAFLKVGDRVRTEIQSIGSMEQIVVSENAKTRIG